MRKAKYLYGTHFIGLGLGLGLTGGGGGVSGYTLYANPTSDTTGTTGVISQLYTNLTGTLTFSKVSGDASISIDSSGAISTSAAIYDGDSVSFIARVDNVDGPPDEPAYVEAPITIIGTASAVIGGVSLGDAGEVGTLFEGFTLAYGDDFDTLPTRWAGNNITGRYSSNPPHVANRRINTTLQKQFYVDPWWRGSRSQSPDVLDLDPLSVSSSVLTVTASPTPSEILPYVPTDYTGGLGDGDNKPVLVSGALNTWPSFMMSAKGDFVIACKVQFPAGVVRGYWPSFWTSTLNWPDFGEIDLVESKKNSGTGAVANNAFNLHISNSDGTSDVQSQVAAGRSWPTGRPLMVVVKKSGSTLTFYDDAASEGTLASVGSYTDARVDRIRGAHDIRFGLGCSSSWDSTTFDIGDWPAIYSADWWQYWAPTSAYTPYAAPNVLTAIDTTPGGSWATTLPSVTSLYGSTPDREEVYAAFDNTDAPGHPTRLNRLPGGMSVNLGTRAVTGTVPTTEGGRVGLLLAGTFDAGGQARTAIQYYNVAPAVQDTIFADQDINYTDAVSLSLAYTDFHSGNLGPHSYAITKTGGSWLTVSYGADNQSATITGTAPSADETVTLSIACTNANGQTTTVTRTIDVVASVPAWTPSSWTDVVEWWDASDGATVWANSAASTPATADSSAAAAITGKILGAIMSNATTGSQPDYVTDANGVKCIDFVAANTDRLYTTNSTVTANLTGNDNAYAIIGRFKRGPAGVTSTPVFASTDGGSTNYSIRHYFSSTNTVGAQRTDPTAFAIASTSTPVSADQWYTVAWIFSGTTVTIRVDGTEVLSAGALNSGSLTLTWFGIGALYNDATNGWSLPFDGRFGEMMLTNSISTSDSNIAEAEAYLAAKWPN